MFGATYTLGLDTKGFGGGLSEARGMLGSFGSGMGGMLAGVAGLAGGIGLLGGAFLGIKKAIHEAAEMEGFLTDFQVLLGGSASAAKRMADGLLDLSASTHLSMEGLSKAASTMLSFGVAGDEVLPMIKQLGDVSGGNAARFESLALVFGQTASAGKLMGQDLLQYINAGFNPLQEIAAKTGKSMESLRKDVERGNITFAQVSEAFRTATSAGGRFFGYTEAKAKTWDGMMSMLQNRVNGLYREFGTPILFALKPMLSDAIGMITRLSATAREWGTGVATGINLLRNAWSDGSLGETAGLSLKAGFMSAIEFLATKLRDLFNNVDSTGLMNGLDLVFDGLGGKLSAAITNGINEALHSVKVMGAPLMSRDAYRQNALESYRLNVTSGKRIDAGLSVLQKDGVMGQQLAGFINGVSTDSTKAFMMLRRKWELATPGATPTLGDAAPKPPVVTANPAQVVTTQRDPVLSDRLAKIGLYIGGSGGPRAQKAAEDTARNTREFITHQIQTNQLLAKIQIPPPGVFA